MALSLVTKKSYPMEHPFFDKLNPSFIGTQTSCIKCDSVPSSLEV